MSSARDIRAMISSLDKSMHQVRSARGADGNVEAREKARAALDEDIADATALLRTARRSGVDASRLIGKIEAAEKLLKKEHHSIEDASSGNDSVYNRPNIPEPRHPNSPPRHSRVGQVKPSRSGDDARSVRSSVAARNAEELRRRGASTPRRRN